MTLQYSFLPVRKNFSSRGGKSIQYIVIHDTGNTGKGATARAHRNYVGTNTRGASAHYFVDDHEICQFVGDSKAAWAVGDGRGRYGITNQNSLSIEICINADGNYEKAVANARELVKNLQERFNIPNEGVVRHYDASRKCCPCSMSKDNWARWKAFKKSLDEPKTLFIDTTKDSIALSVKQGARSAKDSTTYTHEGGLHILKVPAEKIYLSLIGGKTLRQVGAYGINGTFFDMAHPERPESCWGIAMNGGKPLGPNATKNHHDGTKRATLIYGEGRLSVERINDISEVKRPVTWAVGGVGLLPSFDPRLERVPTTISYNARRTAIGFLESTVYLVATDGPMSLSVLRDKMKGLGLSGAVALDGGGSTQMLWKDNQGVASARPLNHMIGVKE